MASALLAKSTGETLVEHSKTVARFSERLYNLSTKRSNENVALAVRAAALLHDIGKCTAWFQDVVLTSNRESSKRGGAINYRHNEVGWAFLSKYLNLDDDVLELVLDAVYWHHGITNELAGYHDEAVLSELIKTDIKAMSSFLVEVLGKDAILNEAREDARFAPLHFNKEDFKKPKAYQKLLVRSCIISGDRMASAVPVGVDDDSINAIIGGATYRSGSMKVTISTYDGPRFDKQLAIAKQDGQTKLVKAPAGYGKTVIGLLWGGLKGNRIIWVCPRNMVAESVYDSILKDMRAMGMNASAELYLSGEVIKSHGTGKEGFTADIIVTNIDSFLFPSIKNSVAERQFLINSCDVVFDEFHELVNENAMFAAFVNTMRCRHRECSGRTLMLSATPMDMTHLWDSHEDKTVILPSPTTHYPAVHDKPYAIRVADKRVIKGGANLVISNAIATAQELKSTLPTEMLVHSEFSKERKANIFDDIITEFGKQSPRHSNKRNVSSTHVLQAAVDASFFNLIESVLSPEATLQRIGRCNRFGDNPSRSSVDFLFDNSSSERMVRSILYDDQLSKLWFEMLKTTNGKDVTLDEFYALYNRYYAEYGDRVRNWINKKWDQSVKQLQSVYPYQHSGSMLDTERKVINADSNRLRSNGDQIFFIVRKSDGSGWSDPMTHTIREGFEQDFKEDGKTQGNILRAMKEITNAGDVRYDYADILKSIDKKGRTKRPWSKLSKMSNTPYIRFDEVYDEEYGMISVELLYTLRREKVAVVE